MGTYGSQVIRGVLVKVCPAVSLLHLHTQSVLIFSIPNHVSGISVLGYRSDSTLSPWSMRMCVLSRFSRPTLCDPTGRNLPASSVHGIFPARILEWVATLFSRWSFWSRDWICICCISCIAGGFFTTEPLGKPPLISGIRANEIWKVRWNTLKLPALTSILENNMFFLRSMMKVSI